MIELIRHRVAVRFNDCDPLGHVNNAVYLTYLEQARLSLWRAQLGFMASDAVAPGRRGPGFILARVEIDFRRQARYGDELEVRLSLDKFGRTSFTYVYEIAGVERGEVVARARTVQVHFDYDEGRAVPLSDDLKTRMSTPPNG